MPHVHSFRLDSIDAEPFPLDEGAITAGNPNPHYATISRSLDGTAITGIFRASPGVFTFTQVGDEWTLVLKGRLIITADDGSRIDCSPGDVMHLTDGAVTTYEVIEEYEDYFSITDPRGLDF
ncbi:cupin domain-containing protein [Corynebacterium pacaense]|uniref:cupin domain-containing protein n=1 Tax=Corynebacterium pacaense TaxID=1816684 RepID=UPI0015C48348|nr:cupin domain-containing protein [Corynebacterium pacaense]